jgi:hypothetical protein
MRISAADYLSIPELPAHSQCHGPALSVEPHLGAFLCPEQAGRQSAAASWHLYKSSIVYMLFDAFAQVEPRRYLSLTVATAEPTTLSLDNILIELVTKWAELHLHESLLDRITSAKPSRRELYFQTS